MEREHGAIGYLPDGTVLDPLDCLEDVKTDHSGSCRSSQRRPLAGLKIIALLGETGGILDEATRESLPDWMENVLAADRTTIRYWLTRLLVSRDPKVAWRCCTRPKAYYLLPEVSAFVGFHRTSKHHHKDVWAHTVRSFVRLCRVH